jgi:5-methylthioadenosine/S-adenosylhomocysteine deaminase
MAISLQTVDLIVAPGWLVPMEPAGVALTDHALVVDKGRILDVLPVELADRTYTTSERISLPDHAVMPGLVNAHTHAAMTLLRGLADDLPLMDWLQNHIWPAEGAHVGRPFCEDGVRLACAEMIRGGTTCFNDMYMFPDISAAAAIAAGMRATVGLIVLDFPTAWASGPDDYLHKGLQVHDSLKNEPLVRTIFAPHAPYTVSDAPLRKTRAYATELGIGIHIHLHETAGEVAMAIDATGKRPWQRLADLDLLGPDLLAVHMTQLTDDEIAQAARYGVQVAHCPESNLKLASGFCPVAKLMKAGVNVALGTDGTASNNDLDMLGEMRTAALLAKGVSGDAQALSAQQALHMATLGGAKALGIDNEIGSLARTKSADFIAIDLSGPETQPLYNPLSQIVYSANRNNVTDVFVAGRALMRKRELLTVDRDAVIAKAREWRGKIKP